MRIVQPGFVIEDEVNGYDILTRLERYGRVCYKSEHKITADSAERFVASLIKSGHESVIEHEKITVRIICDRGISHEIVRHRIASYSQESTRYVRYSDNDIQFIEPIFFERDSEEYKTWLAAMFVSEKGYSALIELGATPEQARTVLPSSLKTEIVVTFNLREWRHFFKLRTGKAAHPQMREIAVPLLAEFKRLVPVVFDDL